MVYSTQVRERALSHSRRRLNQRDAPPNVKPIRQFGLVVRPEQLHSVAHINALGFELVLPKLMMRL